MSVPKNACYAKPFCKDLLPEAQVMQWMSEWRIYDAIGNFLVPHDSLAKTTDIDTNLVGGWTNPFEKYESK